MAASKLAAFWQRQGSKTASVALEPSRCSHVSTIVENPLQGVLQLTGALASRMCPVVSLYAKDVYLERLAEDN